MDNTMTFITVKEITKILEVSESKAYRIVRSLNEELIPMMEEMIHQLEEQQTLLDEVYQELKSSQETSISYQKQSQNLLESNSELIRLLEESIGTKGMQDLLEIQDKQIQKLEIENHKWKELSETLNKENRLLQTQNERLMELIKE